MNRTGQSLVLYMNSAALLVIFYFFKTPSMLIFLFLPGIAIISNLK